MTMMATMEIVLVAIRILMTIEMAMLMIEVIHIKCRQIDPSMNTQ